LPNLVLVDQVNDGSNNVVSGDYFTMGLIPSLSAGKNNPGNTPVSGNIGIAYANWQLYDFGSTKARADAGRYNITALQSGMTLDQQNLEIQVVKYYFQLLTDYNVVQIQSSNLNRVTSIKNAIASFVLNGIRAGVDTSVANAELSEARLNLIDAIGKYQLSQLNLKYLTGLDTSAIFPDTALFQKVNSGLQAVGATVDTSINPEHPLLQYYSNLYDLNTSQLISYKRQFYPQLNLSAAAWVRSSSITNEGFYQNNFSSGFNPLYSNYLVAVSISYNLFDIKRIHDKVKEQKMYTDAAYQQLQLQKNNIGTLLSDADVEIRTSLDKLKEIPFQLDAANKTYSQQLALYKSGLSNIIDVQNALYILNRAQNDKANAIDGAWMAILDKAYATYKMDNLIKVF
jgi:outer membrane protein TolC